MHGARGGGPKGERNGRWRHGLYTCEMIEDRKVVNALARSLSLPGWLQPALERDKGTSDIEASRG